MRHARFLGAAEPVDNRRCCGDFCFPERSARPGPLGLREHRAAPDRKGSEDHLDCRARPDREVRLVRKATSDPRVHPESRAKSAHKDRQASTRRAGK